ncbi:hypothetical protein U771_17615 [Pseudomonas gorinensis]|uniref:Uncharacterized protein n=1 Tax=Pseudomonas gorinensis TaxID=3240790 RepID=A0ACA7P7V2_9PSED|nr:hypothetical protein U771_17615 [Pseudomonas sp. TKP]
MEVSSSKSDLTTSAVTTRPSQATSKHLVMTFPLSVLACKAQPFE